jgi:type IV pilus assembly protein PilY1
LYGGMREVDTEETILRRAYIPQDAHSWAKEYTSEAIDGYRIADYAPLATPNSGKRHFFGNVTPNAAVNCATLSTCSDVAPVLAVVTNSTKRVWDWASSESPVLSATATLHGGSRVDYALRVLTCASGFTADCKPYGTTYKPVGLLHEYGENDLLLFGLLSGSYDKNMSGGRLRKPVGSFKNEVDPRNGRFTAKATLVKTFDALRIRDYNNGRTSASYKGGASNNSTPAEGLFPDWGNPIGEMMYESLRYFSGKAVSSTAFAGTDTADKAVGLPTPAWDDPYGPNSAANSPICARAGLLVISDTNVSYDSDQVPGADPQFADSTFKGDLGGFGATLEAKTITINEPDALGKHFIGQSGTVFDSAPTSKEVTSLGSIRG